MTWEYKTLTTATASCAFFVYGQEVDPFILTREYNLEWDTRVQRGAAALVMMAHYAFHEVVEFKAARFCIEQLLPKLPRPLTEEEAYEAVVEALKPRFPRMRWLEVRQDTGEPWFEDGYSALLSECTPHHPGVVNLLAEPAGFQYQALCLGPPVSDQSCEVPPGYDPEELLFLDPFHGIVITPREFTEDGYLIYRTDIASHPASRFLFGNAGFFFLRDKSNGAGIQSDDASQSSLQFGTGLRRLSKFRRNR